MNIKNKAKQFIALLFSLMILVGCSSTAVVDKPPIEPSTPVAGKQDIQKTPLNKGSDLKVEDLSSPKPKETNNTTTEKPSTTKGNLKVHYIDVGQADSILLQLPNNETMLIDAGNNDDGNLVVNYIKKQNITKIDYLVGTHPHEDHIGGLDTVINALEIGTFYMPKKSHTTKTFEDVLIAAKNKGITINSAKAGVNILSQDGLTIDILSPISDNYEDLNNYSATIKVVNNKNSFLFTGDAEQAVEEQLLNKNIAADVLKVGHHGSKTSTSSSFLDKVSPSKAIISVGAENKYGHPTPEILALLDKKGIDVYRTDEVGTIVVTSDGINITLDKNKSQIKANAPPKEVSAPKSTPKAETTPKISPKEETAPKISSETVYITKTGSKYHRDGCSYLSKSKIESTLTSATKAGLGPCSRCYK